MGLLADPSPTAFRAFERGYSRLLEQRFAVERERFDELAELARHENVYLGCNCPTARQPDVRRCHTMLALKFIQARYPELDVRVTPPRA